MSLADKTKLCVSENHVNITVAVKSAGKRGDIYLKVHRGELPDSVSQGKLPATCYTSRRCNAREKISSDYQTAHTFANRLFRWKNLHHKLFFRSTTVFTRFRWRVRLVGLSTWIVTCRIRRLAGVLQTSLVLWWCPFGRARKAGGSATPALVPGEELLRGGINKPEIFQSELKTRGMKEKNKTMYIFIIKRKKQLLHIDPLCSKVIMQLRM